eukprot:2797149-Alexandrium_andersonii.AAC.1
MRIDGPSLLEAVRKADSLYASFYLGEKASPDVQALCAEAIAWLHKTLQWHSLPPVGIGSG